MKALKMMMSAFLASLMVVSIPACSDDDPVTPDPTPENPTPEKPKPEEPKPEPATTYHFDLYACAVKHGGMSQNKNGTFVRSVKALTADQPMVEFTGKGLDITQDYTMESIVKGKYYYQVPQSPADRFAKFQIVLDKDGDEVVNKISEVPFVKNTYFARKYTHAWLDNETLLIVGTDKNNKVVYWTKLKDSDSGMSILDEGTLDITMPEGATALSTSGLLALRQQDNKLFYFYNGKEKKGMAGATTSTLHVAVIDQATMKVVEHSQAEQKLANESANSAYGELMQNSVMFDEKGTLYLAAFIAKGATGDDEFGSLVRIDADKTTFDPEYNGFPNPEGKLLTVQYLANGKALAYAKDYSQGGSSSKVNNGFYAIIDLATGQRERVKCEGQELPLCGGRFSQRSVVLGDKAYIGVTEGKGENDYPCVYIYDIPTGKVEQGIKLSKGLYFDIIRVIED